MILMLDERTGRVDVPYAIEHGERQQWPSADRALGFTGYVLETHEPLMINEDVAGEASRMGLETQVTGDPPKSVLFVPLIVGGKATGVISLQNIDREHAFTDSDQQLLETLAGSLSVALENARLVHETRQRNAELALINSVQEAIAGELDPQAIYDLVGDKIQEVFDAQVVDIGIYERGGGPPPLPVHDRARRALPGRADRADRLPQARDGDARAAADRRGRPETCGAATATRR